MAILTRVTQLLFLLFVFNACATPMAPTGGPSDSTGPSIIRSYPENGSTNVKTREVEIEFSEFVNRNSLSTNLQIEPDIGIEYSLSWKKRTLYIEFARDLPDSTTLLITLGNKVSDTRNNTMGASSTIAFSTGNQIDTGSITGKILRADNGKGIEDKEVFLFESPYRMGDIALYRAESDTGGNFQFNYLRDTEYVIAQFDDRNRNKQWDSSLERIHVFEREVVNLNTLSADTLRPMYIAEEDTLVPEVLGVGLLSNKRLRIRFSEPVISEPNPTIVIKPKFDVDSFKASLLYISPSDPSIAFAQSEQSFLEDSSYSIEFSNFSDIEGNVMSGQEYSILGSAASDTTIQRFIKVDPINELDLRDSVVLYYASPITQRVLIDSLRVIEGVVESNSWPRINVSNNRLVLQADPEWKDGVDYQILGWNPKTQRRILIPYVVNGPSTWGSLELTRKQSTIANPTNSADSTTTDISKALVPDVRFELYDTKNSIIREGSFSEREIIDELVAREYILRLYIDTNNNGQWDEGKWNPYLAPEPMIIRSALNIQAGFTSTIQFSFD